MKRLWTWRRIYSWRLSENWEHLDDALPVYSVGPCWAHILRRLGLWTMYRGMSLNHWAECYLPEEGERPEVEERVLT